MRSHVLGHVPVFKHNKNLKEFSPILISEEQCK